MTETHAASAVTPSAAVERHERLTERFEPAMLIAALLVIPALVLEEDGHSSTTRDIAGALNWTVWLIFAAEFLALLALAPDRRHWARAHWLDAALVVLTPPFLPAAVQSVRAVRLLRVLRLFRLVALTRKLLSLDGVRFAGLVTTLVVIGGGLAFAAVEDGHHDKPVHALDGIWWAATTVTTVGYGDLYPATDTGRALALAIMAAGIGFVALITAALAQHFLAVDATQPAQPRASADADLVGAVQQLTEEVRAVSDRLAALEARVASGTERPSV